MAWNKDYKKTNWGKKDAPKSYKEKHGKLSPLMTEEDKSFDELRINVMAYTYILRLSN